MTGEAEDLDGRRISRRAVVLGGAAVGVAAAAGILAPKVLRRLRRDALGESVAVPEGSVPTRVVRFDSAARGRSVSVRLVVPDAPDFRGSRPIAESVARSAMDHRAGRGRGVDAGNVAPVEDIGD